MFGAWLADGFGVEMSTLSKLVSRLSTKCLCLTLLAVSASTGAAVDPDVTLSPAGYFELSLQDLLSLQVSSAAKKAQPLSETAAAIYVISNEDIRRSGATSIPDVLRMAPGVNVARIDAHTWAVTARGFNGIRANKLLVLMDGRSIYTPLFGGVNWDVQDVVLEDIERIEVIRGPGASLWGANAVNGVINIITRPAAATQGGYAQGGLGSEESGSVSMRYGGGDKSVGQHWRLYAKGFERPATDLLDGAEAYDGWRQRRAGFRWDGEPGSGDTLRLQGDVYDGTNQTSQVTSSLSPPYRSLLNSSEKVSGGNLLARWTRTLGPASELSFAAYYDHTSRSNAQLNEDWDTFDLEMQHRLPLGVRHDLIWGLGYRYSRNSVGNSFTVSLQPDEREDQLFSGFLQDEITLLPDRLRLILGSKIEHND
jgi:iron complex outermembrane receptor protein